MGQRVNFNRSGKNNKFNKKISIIIIVVGIIFFLIYTFLIALKNVKTGQNQKM